MAFLDHPDRQIPGERFDDYQLGALIGQGGMARVYDGQIIKTGVAVAIKVMSLELSEDHSNVRKRFFNELVSATRVRHPRIVQVHDFGITSQSAPYIVMERLHGRTMEQHLEHLGPMEPQQFLPMLFELLDGLQLAHEHGVVHADLKPSNIFFCDPGTEDAALTILDFGVSCRPAGPGGSIVWGGTPRYAPPERLRGAPAQPQVDVFQIGMVLAEVLSGSALVRVDTVRQVLAQHSSGLTLSEPLATSPFGAVIETAIAPDPLQRYTSIDELREALVLALLVYQSRPTPLQEAHANPAETVLFGSGVSSNLRLVAPPAHPHAPAQPHVPYEHSQAYGTPHSQPYDTPHSRSYATPPPHSQPYGTPHSQPYGTPHSQPYGTPHPQPYGTPHPHSQPYSTPHPYAHSQPYVQPYATPSPLSGSWYGPRMVRVHHSESQRSAPQMAILLGLGLLAFAVVALGGGMLVVLLFAVLRGG